MDKIQKVIDWIAAAVGALLSFLYGDTTPLMFALIAMVALDVVTGIAKGVVECNLSSRACFRGLLRKFLILVLVAVAHVIDAYVTNTYPVLQSAVMMFFVANEAISITENAAALGLPIPKKLLQVLENMHKEAEGEDENKDDNEPKEDGEDGNT